MNQWNQRYKSVASKFKYFWINHVVLVLVMKKLAAKQTIKQKRGFIFISSHSWTPPVQLWFYEHFSNELCVWNGGGALLGLASHLQKILVVSDYGGARGPLGLYFGGLGFILTIHPQKNDPINEATEQASCFVNRRDQNLTGRWWSL